MESIVNNLVECTLLYSKNIDTHNFALSDLAQALGQINCTDDYYLCDVPKAVAAMKEQLNAIIDEAVLARDILDAYCCVC